MMRKTLRALLIMSSALFFISLAGCAGSSRLSTGGVERSQFDYEKRLAMFLGEDDPLDEDQEPSLWGLDYAVFSSGVGMVPALKASVN